jgi:tellurite methyltransferase
MQMSIPESQKWDDRYTRESDFWLGQEPRQLLTSFADILPEEGRALDAASGVGNNALFLAQKGLHVFAFDISEIALRFAKQRMRTMDIRLETAVVDLSNPWLPAEYFVVILNFHFLERATFPFYRKALKPGGLLFFDTFTQVKGIESPEYYLRPGELLEHYQDFEIIHYSEDQLPPSKSHPKRGITKLVARKSRAMQL